MTLTGSSSESLSHRGLAFAGREADRTVLWLRGDHDASTVTALSKNIARVIALDDADFVVDLSDVQFKGAATVVGVIIRARNFLRLQSRTLVLRSPSTCARRVLDVCGLAALLDPSPVENRVDGPADAAEPSNAENPFSAADVTAAGKTSSVDGHHRAEELTTDGAGPGGA